MTDETDIRPRKPPTNWLDRPIQKSRGPKQPQRRVNNRYASRARAPAPGQTKPTGDDIITWIEEKCRIPEGRFIGAPFKLDDFQKAELRRIYDNQFGTRRAILSFARKNGKTGLAAVLLLVHLVGPKAIPNSNLFSAAQSREQAALIFNMAAKIVRLSPELRGAIVIKDSSKELTCPERGTKYRALSAEASTAYGLSPAFIVHDELGQVRGPRSALYEALETATGAQEAPLSVIISTQAPTDSDLLSVLIDDALAGNDPRVVCKLYAAPVTLDPFDINTIRLANPALGTFLNEVEARAMAADAKRMPSREAEFRNLVLNQRIEAAQHFIAPALWQACGTPVGDIRQCDEVYGGLDLSEATDLTALVLIGKIGNSWHVRPWFWLPSEAIFERSKTDHVPYDKWAEQGYLETVAGAAITYDVIAARICEILQQHPGLKKIAFDRWNFAQFKPWLTHHKWNEQSIAEKWVEFGQGTQSMSPALRELESRITRRELAHGNHPILNSCAANAVIAGNKDGKQKKDSSARKLDKKRSTGRIDGLVALSMAMGIAPMGAPVDVASLIG